MAPADRILGAQRGVSRPPSWLSLAGLGLRMTCSMLRAPGDTQSSAPVSLGRVVPPSTEATVVFTGSASHRLFLFPLTPSVQPSKQLALRWHPCPNHSISQIGRPGSLPRLFTRGVRNFTCRLGNNMTRSRWPPHLGLSSPTSKESHAPPHSLLVPSFLDSSQPQGPEMEANVAQSSLPPEPQQVWRLESAAGKTGGPSLASACS